MSLDERITSLEIGIGEVMERLSLLEQHVMVRDVGEPIVALRDLVCYWKEWMKKEPEEDETDDEEEGQEEEGAGEA